MTFTKIFSFLKSWVVNFTILAAVILLVIGVTIGMVLMLKTYGLVIWILFLIAIASGITTFILEE